MLNSVCSLSDKKETIIYIEKIIKQDIIHSKTTNVVFMFFSVCVGNVFPFVYRSLCNVYCEQLLLDVLN